jgi:hypothetical protein
MPRYKLRTLLILMAIAAVPLARIAYLRRMADIHRQAASRFVAGNGGLNLPEFRHGVGRLVAQGVPLASLNPDSMQVAETQPKATWQSAIYHEGMAIRYEDAVYMPWLPVWKIKR